MRKRPRTIVEKHKANFETLRRASVEGALALVACKLRATGEDVAVACAMNEAEGGEVGMVPLAVFLNGNPFELLVSPLEVDEAERACTCSAKLKKLGVHSSACPVLDGGAP